MLPRVRELEERHHGVLVAIGVHAGKFHRERETPSIATACRRLGVTHPVVNDRQFRVWRDHSVQAWPTIVVVDPEARVVGQQSGELPLEGLDRFVSRVVDEHRAKGTLVEGPWRLAAPPAPVADTGPLRFPGKVAFDIEGRVAISDSGHDRVLFGRLVGNSIDVEHVIGTGSPGFADGDYGSAAFHEPQGLALAGDMLIVADRANHAVRMIDLASGKVATMAGTGQLRGLDPAGGDPLGLALRSPWDVLLHEYELFIAMAGSHQIWRLDLREGRLTPYAGSGAEAIDDGPLARATLAQPMALATDEARLYFADAESSSIRVAPLDGDGEVTTLVGTGLFEFGDRDGVGEEARLQHPAGLAWGQGNHRLWIADSYNDKLKLLDPRTRAVETVEPFDEELDEPMGIASAGHQLLVTDTNRHRVLRVDQIDKRVVELEVTGA
jgi:hypothetical protein